MAANGPKIRGLSVLVGDFVLPPPSVEDAMAMGLDDDVTVEETSTMGAGMTVADHSGGLIASLN